MLRISESGSEQDVITFRLEGQLSGPWVEETRRSCAAHAGNGHRLNLDLEELSFVDQDGIALLQVLAQNGVGLSNCSQFLKERLKEVFASVPQSQAL